MNQPLDLRCCPNGRFSKYRCPALDDKGLCAKFGRQFSEVSEDECKEMLPEGEPFFHFVKEKTLINIMKDALTTDDSNHKGKRRLRFPMWSIVIFGANTAWLLFISRTTFTIGHLVLVPLFALAVTAAFALFIRWVWNCNPLLLFLLLIPVGVPFALGTVKLVSFTFILLTYDHFILSLPLVILVAFNIIANIAILLYEDWKEKKNSGF